MNKLNTISDYTEEPEVMTPKPEDGGEKIRPRPKLALEDSPTNLFIETDLGHDPDDFLAITYLHAAGANIQGISVTPGDPDQIAVAKLICKELNLNIPVGAALANRKEHSCNPVHHEMLRRYGASKNASPDNIGYRTITDSQPVESFFIIGPADITAEYLIKDGTLPQSLTMQGGFLPYDLYSPTERLDKFEGKRGIRTFNMSSSPHAAQILIDSKIPTKKFVGKNVCHTIKLTRERFSGFPSPTSRAAELFTEMAMIYLEKNHHKKLHDPTAAVCHLHPEIGTWIRGNPKLIEPDRFTTNPNPHGDYILADINRESLWHHLKTFN